MGADEVPDTCPEFRGVGAADSIGGDQQVKERLAPDDIGPRAPVNACANIGGNRRKTLLNEHPVRSQEEVSHVVHRALVVYDDGVDVEMSTDRNSPQ